MGNPLKHDQLFDGRAYRLFTVIDGFNRKALSRDIDLSLPAERVVRALDQITKWRGKPLAIHSDNSPECMSNTLTLGRKAQESGSITSSQESHSKTPILNAITEPCGVMTGSITICSNRL